MRGRAALAVLLVPAFASAQTVWSYGEDNRIQMGALVDCAAILLNLETLPGEAPEFGGAPVDFQRMGEEMLFVAANAHGTSLTERLFGDAEEAWLSREDTMENRTAMADALNGCWPQISVHLPEPEDPVTRPRMGMVDGRLTYR